MSVTARESPVALSLFDLVERYAKQIEDGKIDVKNPLKRTTPIIEFCRTFYQQFFEHELGLEIKGVDQSAKAKAIELRHAFDDQAAPVPRLIAWFEELCDIWIDVLGFSYAGSASEFRRFHNTYVVRLLERIETWARAADYAELLERTKTARAVYGRAVTKL
jgi:hypothetical protein